MSGSLRKAQLPCVRLRGVRVEVRCMGDRLTPHVRQASLICEPTAIHGVKF